MCITIVVYKKGLKMRETKFKILDTRHNRFVNSERYGDEYYINQDGKVKKLEYREPKSSWSTDDNYVAIQYTGLKDKNGVEIYEGDIVESFFKVDKPKIYIVEYDIVNPCFVMVGVYNRNLTEFDFDQCGLRSISVIGNIYENPELLQLKDSE